MVFIIHPEGRLRRMLLFWSVSQ